MPTTEDVRVHEGFVTAFDFRTRNPRWVLEHVTAETLAGPADRWARARQGSGWAGWQRQHNKGVAPARGSLGLRNTHSAIVGQRARVRPTPPQI